MGRESILTSVILLIPTLLWVLIVISIDYLLENPLKAIILLVLALSTTYIANKLNLKLNKNEKEKSL